MKKLIGMLLIIILAFNSNVISFAMPGYVQSVEINADDTVTMRVGEELTLTATAVPVGFDYSYMTWTLNNPSVASLECDDGTTKFEPPTSTAVITAISEGTVTVTVYAAVDIPEPEEYTTHDSVTINILPKQSDASVRRFPAAAYNNKNEQVRPLSCVIESLKDDIALDMDNLCTVPEQSLHDSEYELLTVLDLKSADENNPYPHIDETAVRIGVSIIGGGTTNHLGKNYKVFLLKDESKEEVVVSVIDDYNIKFNINRLGKYVLYFDEYNEYAVKFFNEIPPENSSEADYIYYVEENLRADDIVKFPKIPAKDGYVFAGWKAKNGNGIYYTEPQPFFALDNDGRYYASWCSEDEYVPIKIDLASNEPITKGEENGKKIILKTNYGIFTDGDSFPKDWRTDYNSETNEQIKADILSEWKSKWNIVGNDDLMIETATRIDDKTVELALSGDSSDKYISSEIYIEFDNDLLLPEPYEDGPITVNWIDTKIKQDSDGVRAKMYKSDNGVTISNQNRPSTGGGGSVSKSVSNPVASEDSSEVVKGTNIELSCSTKDAKIYYTTDGSQPTAESHLYQQPIEITGNMTLKFIAVLGTRKSAVQTKTYTLKKADISLKKEASTIKYIVTSDDKFYPDSAMTRYEILSALNRLFDIETIGLKSNFSDVTDEYADIVDLFVGANIIDGYPNNTFGGEIGITRAEFVKILSIMLDAKEENTSAFNDISGHWCEKYINSFATLKLLSGYPDGSFKPDNIITRAEVIAVLNRITQNANSDEKLPFKDIDENHWAYRDICKAVECQ